MIPGKDGGRYTKDNVVYLCPNCHRAATHHPDQIETQVRAAHKKFTGG